MSMVPPPGEPGPGTKDMHMGPVSDRDQEYHFGRAPLASTACPWPFTMTQLIRLIKLRGSIQDRRISKHINEPDPDGL